MELTGVGGGVMLAIAAVLWLAYLLPSWLKNREYLATEKNAVRLQQTIRVLAETSEVSRTELLRQLPSGPVAVGRPARPVFETADKRSLGAVHRLRRTRVATAFVLLLSVLVGLVQGGVMIAGAGAATTWLLLAASALGVLSSVAMLARLAEVARSRRSTVAAPVRRTSLGNQPTVAAASSAREDWTPVAVPRPLYLSRSAAPAQPAADPVLELRAAAAAAERALRDVEQPPAITPAVQPAAAPSRFASMGIVDVASAPAPDLDAVLARRRAAS